MSALKEVGVPFPISLVTEPAQPGLNDFVVKRFSISAGDPLAEPTDITALADIDEFIEPVTAYVQEITVAADRLRGHERIMVAGDTAAEIKAGHKIAIGNGVYIVKAVAIAADGTGYVDLALPLREAISIGDAITASGATGRYRITVQEDIECSVQYNVSSVSSLPTISEDTAVVSVETAGSSSDAVVDNSKLLL